MKLIDLTIPLGIGTPPWPTYEPLQLKYFNRLAPNGANEQVLTHSNHLGTHLDGEIHFYTPGKDIAALGLNDFLVGPGTVVDLSEFSEFQCRQCFISVSVVQGAGVLCVPG